MATVEPNVDAVVQRRDEQPAASARTARAMPQRAGNLVVLLPSLAHEALSTTLRSVAEALAGTDAVVLTPDGVPAESFGLATMAYTPSVVSRSAWLPTAGDYLNAHAVMTQHDARGCLMLGAETQALTPKAIARLAAPLDAGMDLVTANYMLGPREGLFNSAILYPLTRGLFGTNVRYPLAIDQAMSQRMVERVAATAQRAMAAGQEDAIVWPVAEAAVAGFSVGEAMIENRTLPQPEDIDLNTILTRVAGSLFADIESKAALWQRTRTPAIAAPQPLATHVATEPIDVQPMLDAFRNAYANLQEIWSLVLPPNSLLGLKKLSLMTASNFHMQDGLWTRTVYDFVLAYRLRTLNRGHLLGALTPLYLAWVASHLLQTQDGSAEAHIERVAQSFTDDKPYLVSRWRWPDRFNP
jgi:hypothetical protein